MILACGQMKSLEEAAFKSGVDAAGLMEKAGHAIADVVSQFFPAPGRIIAFCGKGNNAGDVLVAARVLADRGWQISIDCPFNTAALSELTRRHIQPFGHLRLSAPIRPPIGSPLVLLDGLLGIGTTGNPRGPIAESIHRIRSLRSELRAFVVAADIPSGLDGDSGAPGDPCVEADLTVTIGHAKSGLVADSAANFTGRLAVADLAELSEIKPAKDDGPIDRAELITPHSLQGKLPLRPFDSHKGTWGRAGIIAGSRGFLGAARLSSEAAVRAGAGLVTLYAKPNAYELLAATCAPEVMVRPVDSYMLALDDKLDAIGIGPGLGSDCDEEILEIATRFEKPMLIDADALNAISRHPEALTSFAGPRLLTPHPGEMARLFPKMKSRSRREAAEEFTRLYSVTLLLKGARTIITEAGAPPAFNTTGNPGMGSGGMGDVLTGVASAFLAQHHSPRDAAMLGAWLCGRAAERAVFAPGGSAESLCASDIPAHLGGAISDLRSGAWQALAG